MINRSKNFSEVKAVGLNQRKHVRVDDVLKVDYLNISQKDYKGCKSKPEIILKRLLANPLKRPMLRLLV